MIRLGFSVYVFRYPSSIASCWLFLVGVNEKGEVIGLGCQIIVTRLRRANCCCVLNPSRAEVIFENTSPGNLLPAMTSSGPVSWRIASTLLPSSLSQRQKNFRSHQPTCVSVAFFQPVFRMIKVVNWDLYTHLMKLAT